MGRSSRRLRPFLLLVALAACKPGPRSHADQAADLTPPVASAGPASTPAPSAAPEASAPLASPPRSTVLPWQPPASPQDAGKLAAQASACLADAACDDAELERRLRQAAARGVDVCSCWLEGLGVARDETLARACLEHHVATESAPDGNSCSNARLQLALLLGLGRGGRADPAGARLLLDGCFADLSQGSVLAAVEAGEAPEGGVVLCETGGLTTLAFGGCSAPEQWRRLASERALLRVAASAGPRALAAARRANLAFRDYIKAEASLAYDAYRDGSMRTTEYVFTERAAGVARRERLARLSAYAPVASKASAASDAAELSRREALSLQDTDGKHRALARQTGEVFARYRAAELTLYQEIFAARFGREPLRLDVRAMLDRERSSTLGENAR